MTDLPPIPEALRGLVSHRTWREMSAGNTDMRYAGRRGARARQTFHYRVRNARSRWIARHYPYAHRYRVWHIVPGHPGGDYAETGREPVERCTPTVLQRFDERGRTHYRAACLGCRWEAADDHTGARQTVINGPVEEAHDHAFPGWRDLPCTPSAAVDDADGPARRHLDLLYPPGWHAAGAPLLTRRTTASTLHQPPRHGRAGYLLRLPAPARQAGEADGSGATLF